MEKELFDFVAERAQVLSTTPAAKQATQEAAQAWLKAAEAGADAEGLEAATTQFVDFLVGRPSTIEGVIAFAQGPAVQMMGEEAAAAFLAKQLERQAAGEKYCDCPACTAATQILAKFGRIEL